MKKIQNGICLLAIYVVLMVVRGSNADIYMHNPRGSNNRLDEAGRERNNANRLFDSQNNNRGGYNVGSIMNFFTSSLLQIEWTNQHSCRGKNANCDIVIQYMCSDNIRDGAVTDTIPEALDNCLNKNCNTDIRYALNENYEYYQLCTKTSRNKGLFTADQGLKGDSARFTRQNANGARYGYECPEERDYYPYWRPTDWIDIAVLTNDARKCHYYQTESENVKSRWYCDMKNVTNKNQLIPINKQECEKIIGTWTESPSHGVDAPICRENQPTRDNHLGNTLGGNTPVFNWILPKMPSNKCVLRVRYNISTNDYNSNQAKGEVDLSKKYGLSPNDAKQRGYVFKNNPTVQLFSDINNFKLNLAINTAQYGRVFQDRSHTFQIRGSPVDESVRITNLNVRGKRGNIVQVYPAVEYDFVPNQLETSKDDYIHIQWTGSNSNSPANDGQGTPGTDRSNMVLLTKRDFVADMQKNAFKPLNVYGSYAANYPSHLNVSNIIGLTQDDLIKLAVLLPDQQSGDLDQLDDAPAYFNLGLRRVASDGVFQYMCTRNNDFSNRDQKGRIISYNYPHAADYIGLMGGNITFSRNFGKVEIPLGSVYDLNLMKFRLRDADEMDAQVLNASQINGGQIGSYFFTIDRLNEKLKQPLKVRMKSKRSASIFESPALYRIGDHNILTKVEANVNGDQVVFDTDQPGTFVVKYERNIGAIVGLVIGLVALVVLIGGVALFLIMNPHFFTSLNYRATNLKNSLSRKI